MEGVQAVLLSAHAGIVARWPLVGHVLYAARAQRAGRRWSRETHVQVANWLVLAYCRVRSSWAWTRKLEEKTKTKNKTLYSFKKKLLSVFMLKNRFCCQKQNYFINFPRYRGKLPLKKHVTDFIRNSLDLTVMAVAMRSGEKAE